MFKQLALFFFVLAACALAAPLTLPTEEQSKAELKAAGMTESSIDGLSALTQRFLTGYLAVQANKEETEKFLASYTADAQNFINSMPAQDQTIYNNYLKKYGLA